MLPETGEPIRLVIWDLDETFWRGTLCEGGVEFVEAHNQLVIDLAQRGILSSICSRNDEAPVRELLTAKGLWDYFIFPSLDWTAKPARLAALIEAVQLRPETILFIDDNPMNRASAAEAIPGLRVAPETVIAQLAAHTLLRGKPDTEMTRLKQYKLMENRAAVQAKAADPREFLRASEIRVEIEVDLAPHWERVVELINRTNQLNFTKWRLSDDVPTAIAKLKDWMASEAPWIRAGLIRVRDRYGDYGYCGFYAQTAEKLRHFCFSCRILGFGVESWLFQKLGRPQIDVAGEVLVDLKTAEKIDWIEIARLGETETMAPGADAFPLRLRGRCEAGLLAQYLRFAGFAMETQGAYREGLMELYSDSVVNLAFASSAELKRLGFAEYPGSRLFAPTPRRSAFVFFAHREFLTPQALYRHKREDFAVCLGLTDFTQNLVACEFEAAAAHIRAREPDTQRAEAQIAAIRHLRAHYDAISAEEAETLLRDCLKQILQDAPADALLLPVLLHPQAKDEDGVVWPLKQVVESRDLLRAALGGDARVVFVDASDCVQSPDELIDWRHYDRVVYYRMASFIIERCRTLA